MSKTRRREQDELGMRPHYTAPEEAQNLRGVGCLGVECAEAKEASSQAERGTVVGTSLYCVFWLSVLSCLSQE